MTRLPEANIFFRTDVRGTDTHSNSVPTMDLVPGGYLFTHMIFWTVIAMVAVGTQAVAIILTVGLGLLVVEAFTQGR